MSNPSLKEQLQASLGLSLSVSPAKGKKTQKNATQNEKTNQKPAWLAHAQYGVELLRAHFPNCFKDTNEIQPLKVGIKQDLVKLLSSRDNIVIGDKACMVNSLAYYVNSPAYHKTVIEGAARIDLFGQAEGVVTAEEAKYSIECRQAKLQKKKTSQTRSKAKQEEETI